MVRRYVPVKNRKNRQSSLVVRQAAIAKRRELLLSLRQAGASYSEIVRANIGYKSTAHVSKDMKYVLAQFQYETPEDVLVLDLARLDEMQKIATAAMRSGDKQIMGTIMQIMRFRRETLGITQEQIAERQLNKTNVQNNGIMVIQGQSTGDYVAAMAAAAGVDTSAIQKELETISHSNKIIDAEIVDDGKPKTRKIKVRKKTLDSFQDRLLQSAKVFDEEMRKDSVIPPIDPETPLLNIDMPNDSISYAVPIKDYDHNVDMVSGIPYRKPPQKMTKEQSQKVIKRKLNRIALNDELNVETIEQEI